MEIKELERVARIARACRVTRAHVHYNNCSLNLHKSAGQDNIEKKRKKERKIGDDSLNLSTVQYFKFLRVKIYCLEIRALHR